MKWKDSLYVIKIKLLLLHLKLFLPTNWRNMEFCFKLSEIYFNISEMYCYV